MIGTITMREEFNRSPAWPCDWSKYKGNARLIPSFTSAVAIALVAMTVQAHAARVKLFVQTPFPWETATGAPSLKYIESAGSSYPFIDQGFGLDYNAVEAAIQTLIETSLPPEISGVEHCADPCPDVNWRIRPKAKFVFTQRGGPAIAQIGASGQSRVKVTLPTEVRIDLHADIEAWTWFDSTGTVPIDAFVVLGVNASTELSLWPDIETGEPSVTLSLNDKNVDVDLNGVAIEVGAKWGGAAGLVTPVGPLLGSLIGGLLGDAAAEAAEDRIRAEFSARLTGVVRQAEQEATAAARAALVTAAANLPSPKETLMAFQVPGTAATVGELSSVFGSTIELHTVTSGGGLASSAVQRFSATPGSGRVDGEIRFPKEACKYVTTDDSNVLYGGMTVSTGRMPINGDLAEGECASKVDAAGLISRVFLGGNPQDALGASAESRPYWTGNFGSAALSGSVRDDGEFYTCRFEINNLPAAAFVEIEAVGNLASRLAEQAFRKRFVTVTRSSGAILLDEYYTTVPSGSGGTPEITLGGPQGQCMGGGGSSTGLSQSVLDELEALTDPDRCPQCAVTLVPGSENIRVLDASVIARTRAGAAVMHELMRQRNLPARQIWRR